MGAGVAKEYRILNIQNKYTSFHIQVFIHIHNAQPKQSIETDENID